MTRLSGEFQTDLASIDALAACAQAIDGLGWRIESIEDGRIVAYAESGSIHNPPRIDVVLSASGQLTDIRIIGTDNDANRLGNEELIAELDRVRDAIKSSVEAADAAPLLAKGPLFRERPLPLQIITGAAVPAAFGAIAGVVLGISASAYWVLQVIALVGAVLAGLEHPTEREGAKRGLVGGTLYGTFILIAHAVAGTDATVELPDFAPVLVVFTAAFGILATALGGRLRRRASESQTGRVPEPGTSSVLEVDGDR